jgi:hypothetical protein
MGSLVATVLGDRHSVDRLGPSSNVADPKGPVADPKVVTS